MSARRTEAGFTLVEVLISLFIFALISAGTMGAMLQTFAAKDRLNAVSAELADIAAFRSIVRADMNAMTLRPMRDGVGGTENYLVTTRNPEEAAAILTFSRLGRSNPTGAARGQVERVRYVFRDGQFIRESLAHENPAQREGWRGRVLLEGIESVEVVQKSRRSFGGAPPVNLTLTDWTVLVNPTAPVQVTEGAVEFKITMENGAETAHLFETGS
jgi:general secretion pathway protein J